MSKTTDKVIETLNNQNQSMKTLKKTEFCSSLGIDYKEVASITNNKDCTKAEVIYDDGRIFTFEFKDPDISGELIPTKLV